ncbi:MAG TPA: ABC transporter ATP-binding protein [Actinomycetes bacterium]|nr:ABC transporter ATP-binding protein [Actinomycetes bacterium]
MSTPVRTSVTAATQRNGVNAVDVVGLRKSFRRKVSGKDARGKRKTTRRTVHALDDVTFSVARGETVAILGQNGSGKSTLIRILSTLLLHEAGVARVFGHDVMRDPHPVRRLVNRVSVEASFFKKMSAAENLSYAARFYGMGSSSTRDRIPLILERVGFPSARRNEPMENLSRGMQQKVALARALLTSPVLLLLDEPTTGLDPRSKREVQDFIRDVRVLHDSTILLCTHDLDEAEALSDRVGILDRGQLLVLAPVPELLQQYDASSLEEAFFAATGRELATEEEEEDDDDEREVFG